MLLHGGLLTIDINFSGLIPTLAKRHQVIAVELQGHGRTADIDREITPANSATDVVALLDHLRIDRAHIVGHSMGAAVALELAVNHPTRVRSVVPISGSVRPDGMHPDLTDPTKFATSTRMPTQEDFAEFAEAYQRLSPHPEHFEEFMATLSVIPGRPARLERRAASRDHRTGADRAGRPRLHHPGTRRPDERPDPRIAARGPTRHHPHAGHQTTRAVAAAAHRIPALTRLELHPG